MLRADDSPAGPVEQAVLRGQHDDRDGAKNLVVLDQRAGLIAVEARHHDVYEDDVRLVIGNLGESIETVNGGVDLAPLLRKKGLGRAPDRLAVIDDQNLEALELRVGAGHGHRTPSTPKLLWWPARTAGAAGFNISAYPLLCQTRHVFRSPNRSPLLARTRVGHKMLA